MSQFCPSKRTRNEKPKDSSSQSPIASTQNPAIAQKKPLIDKSSIQFIYSHENNIKPERFSSRLRANKNSIDLIYTSTGVN